MTDASVNSGPAARPRGWTGARPGGRLGNGFFVLLLRCGGLRLAPFFICFVALWFVATRRAACTASIAFGRRLGRVRSRGGALWFAFRHFYTYGLLLVDRLAMLGGGHDQLRIEYHGEEVLREACRSRRGVVLATAHFGNWAAMGQVVARLGIPLTVLMYDGEEPGMREQLARSEGAAAFAVLYTDGGASTAAAVLDLLRAGQAVGMMGDRVFAGRPVRVPFLGGEVALPAGPYVLAGTSGALLLQAHLLRTGPRRYALFAQPIEVLRSGARQDRQAKLQHGARQFADALAALVREQPLQWGNFHDLWAEEAPA